MTQNTKILIGLGGLALAYFIFKNSKKTESIDILKQWKQNFDSKNLDGIVNTYSPKAILVSTFGDILQGRDKIQQYFKDLFQKDNLSVTYLDNPIESRLDGSTMYTGIYEFSYTENNQRQSVKARYSIITKDGQITKQHSSEVPN
jgi:hypothetical protein